MRGGVGSADLGPCTAWTAAGRCAILALLFGAMPASAQNNPADASIRGQAVDELSGTGLSGALVEFLDDSRRVLHRATADDEGYFIFPRLPPGPFRLRVTQFGYMVTTTPVWWVQVGDVLDVMVWLSPDAIPLAPLEVVARTRRHLPVLDGFYRRMEDAVGGHFLAREEIEATNATRVTDLLANLPGVRLETSSGAAGNGRVVTFGRSLLGSRGGRCPAQVYVDGILASRGGGAVPLDDLATPGSLEGLEVYRGLASVPAEFLSPEARCGVIVLWTRRRLSPS